ncbi:uncharacterized protein J3D65DRAFT_690887 [Phyllosticta citribraziliensis]|uniref:DUF7918 domain-containing protein n=1 Tax=Phyllosticta citribraziliensis TaxID=989973 RepID=A0ABR1M6S3_9PEZI
MLSPPVDAAADEPAPQRLRGPELTRKQQHVMDGLDVHIEVKDQRLEEYVDAGQEGPPGTAIKYVVAQPGENFTIAFNFDHEFAYKDFDLYCEVYFDGNRVDGLSLEKEDNYVQHPHWVSAIRYSQGGKRFIRPMMFSNLIINEEEEALDSEQQKAVDALGEIQLIYWRIKACFEYALQEEGDTSESYTSKELKQIPEVSEKALKGRSISHHVKFGEALAIGEVVMTGPRSRWHVESDSKPFATYTFRYRSTEALKSMGLIPRTPEPVPLEERPIEDLTPEEMKEEQLETAKVVKHEASSETEQTRWEPWYRSQWEDGDELAVTEVRPAKRRRVSGGPIDTVDLTDD